MSAFVKRVNKVLTSVEKTSIRKIQAACGTRKGHVPDIKVPARRGRRVTLAWCQLCGAVHHV